MKGFFFCFFFIAACFGANFSHAQLQRCGTYEVHKMRLETDPQYRAYYETIGSRMEAWSKAKTGARMTEANITIPVVVHVLYNSNDQNISDAQIHSQIAILNEDYTASNWNIDQVPDSFQPLIGNAHLNFCLATVTPAGDYSTGIERRHTSASSFSIGDSRMKYYNQGGLDAWDRTRYLNIWVCNLNGGVLGYTISPPCPPDIDGCVILYSVFGKTGTQYPQYTAYNYGRTSTHEIGHWLGLYHIWGDDGDACWGTDYVDDTPNQAGPTYKCPTFPKTDLCSNIAPGIMFMDYMDYTDDRCMSMFSAGQVAVMNNILNTQRPTLSASTGCVAPEGLAGINAESFIELYPNPANDFIYIDSHLPAATVLNIAVYDMPGKKLITSDIHQAGEQHLNLDVSSLSAGIYMLMLTTDEGNIAKRFAVKR